MKKYIIPLFIFLALGFIACQTVSLAGGRIDITPRRIVIEPRDRNGELTLLNMGDEEGTYRISILNYRQNENGVYTTLEGPLNPAFDPEQVLRLSPRQFTLPLQGRQKVRFSIRKPADLPDGEYRFHLLATRMSDFGPPSPVGSGEKSVSMAANISTAIPVIVRHGQTQVSATISDLAYIAANAEGKPEAKLTINRDGNISTLGTIKAYWTPAGGETQQVGIITNMNVFTDIAKRFVAIPLEKTLEGSGTLHIVYTTDKTQEIYAEATLQR